MRLDFTPRKFMAPQTPEEAAKLIQDTKTLVDLYMQVDRLSRNQAENLAEAQVKAGNLNNELKRLQKNLDDLVFNSDYLYRSFQDTTAELRNQNILLKLGKSAFSDLTNQAQKLTNFQQGYSDLQEKDFKKIKESYQVQKKEIDYIVDNLSKNEDFRKRELVRLSSIEEAGGRLSKIEKEFGIKIRRKSGKYSKRN
jgi:histone acetyltransferase (RNA polymerase elongator complex component)